MHWDQAQLRGPKTGIDWAAPGSLHQVDPYLVWFDLSAFAGAQIESGNGLKFLIERDGGEQAGVVYETPTLPLDQVAALLAQTRSGEVRRFELATLVALEAAGPNAAPAPDAPIGGAQPARPRSTQPMIVAFIDYGCAFAHRKFRMHPDRPGDVATRVLALWDQEGQPHAHAAAPGQPTLAWRRPADFGYGLETLRDGPSAGGALCVNEYIARFRQADGSIDEERCYAQSGYHAATRPSTHGTHLMDIATGCPDPQADPQAPPALVPHAADIVFVQLPRWVRGRQVGGLLRAHVLDALHYVLSLAGEHTRVIVNLSYGTYAGPHDGSSILEQAIDRLIERHAGRLQVVVAAGNAYDKSLHAQATIEPRQWASFAWHNLPDDPSDSFVELWLPADATQIEVRVVPPHFDGACPCLPAGSAACLRRDDGSPIAALVHAGHDTRTPRRRMVLLAVAPTQAGTARRPAPYGTWKIELHNQGKDKIEVNAWCERDDLGYGGEPWPRQGYFSRTATSEVLPTDTLSSLAHGRGTIVVGATVGGGPVTSYSSTGPAAKAKAEPVGSDRVPNVLAPAEESAALPGLAAAAVIGRGTVRLNGTSVAAACVTRYLLDGGELQRGPPRGLPAGPHPDDGRVPRLPAGLAVTNEPAAARAAATARPAAAGSRRSPDPSAAG